MRNYKILVGFMVIFFVAFLSLNAVASARGRSDDDSGSGHKKKGKKFHQLQVQIDANRTSIENIELTPGPKGDQGEKGDKGDPGTNGVDGQDGEDGTDGTNGEPGADGVDGDTQWSDESSSGYNSISTIGSINIGDDFNSDYCDTRNEGTIKYNTVTKAFEGCNGVEWVSITPPVVTTPPVGAYAIGDTGPAGGIVFYITDGGLHGLEAAPADLGAGAVWGCTGVAIVGADGTAVGTGAQNTIDILAGCSETGTAASIVDAYTLEGYDDWFLPSKDELDLLYTQKDVVGGFVTAFGGAYWSSTENGSDSNRAWFQYFQSGVQGNYSGKWGEIYVRAVRSF